VVRIAALLVQPVMPTAADRLLDLLSQPADRRDFGALAVRLAPGTALPPPAAVFPRYQVV
jgi:methionyl-tRNA synthetase